MKASKIGVAALAKAMVLSAMVAGSVGSLRAADVFKENNSDNLNLGSSWRGGVAPTAGDVAVWDSGVTSAGGAALGADLEWLGLRIANPVGTVIISNSANFLTNGAAGLDMSQATVDLNFNPNLVVGADQVWDIAGDRTLNLHTVNTSRGEYGAGSLAFTNSTGIGTATINMAPGASGSVGFNDNNGNRQFTGNWIIGTGALVKNIRNGRTAWGTNNSIVLAGGTLAPWQGNWTWTTPIVAQAGTTSTIDNKNGGSNRSLKLQGPLSGGGALVFDDTAGSMNSIDLGFILTATNNALSGSITIAPAGKVRVGGVPGDATGTGSGTGSLGAAVVTNNGILTYSTTNAIAVPNDFHGYGTLRFGMPTLTGTASQVVTLSGNNADFLGAMNVATGTVLFANSAAFPAGAVTVPFGTVAGTLFPLNQAALGHVDMGAAGVMALGASSANALDLTSWPMVSLGSVGTNTISGSLIPGNSGTGYNYRLGGAGGTLIVNSELTDYNGNSTGLIICGGGSGGVVILNHSNSFTGPVLIQGGTVLDPTGHGFGQGNLQLGLYQGAGEFNRPIGTGIGQVQILAGSSGFSTLGGPLTVNLGAAVVWGSVGFAPTELVLNTATADNPLTLVSSLDLNAAGQTVNVDASNPTNAATISAPIVNNGFGPAGLTKTGAGTLVLAATNTFDGGLTLSGGRVAVSSDANLAGPASMLNFLGGALRVVGTELTSVDGHTVNWNTFNGGFDIADPANTFTATNTFYGAASDALRKWGPGTLVLAAENYRLGPTFINEGVMRIGNSNSLSGSVVTINSAFGLDLNHLDATMAGLGGVGSFDLGTNSLALTQPALSSFNGTLVGTGRILLTGAGTGSANYQVFAGASNSTFSGTLEVQNAGLLILNGTNLLAGLPALELTLDPADTNNGFVLGDAYNFKKATVSRLAGTGGTIRSDWATFVTGPATRVLSVDQSTDSRYDGIIEGDRGAAGPRDLVLEKLGSGKLTLTGYNTYRGATIVGGGTLALAGAGALVNTPSITLASGATFDVSGLSPTPFNLAESQAVAGSGTVSGSVLAQGTIQPGSSSDMGKLDFSADLALGGATVMKIAKTGSVVTHDSITAKTTLQYGGTLVVTNIGPGTLANGDRFVLFSAGTLGGSFASVVLPNLAGGLSWKDTLAADGAIEVVGSLPTTPTNLNFSFVGGELTLSWPADYTGWQLQAQTNAPGAGLGSTWHPIPGSAAVHSLTIPIDPNSGSVFYRLALP